MSRLKKTFILVLLILGGISIFLFTRHAPDVIAPELEEEQVNITIEQPEPNSTVSAPLTVSGQVRGYWFYEAQFQIELRDADGNTIATALATSTENWMTTEVIPFSATFDEFSQPSGTTGELVFIKENPSGLPEYEEEVHIPINY